MKNKFRIGEIVVVNGKGKIYDKHFKALGIIQYKDYYFNEYFVTMISSNKEDWFSEEDIEIVMDRKYKKTISYIFLFPRHIFHCRNIESRFPKQSIPRSS